MSLVCFACKCFPVNQILRCSFGLSKTELVLLKNLLNRKKEVSLFDLKVGKDRSVVQRSLSGLVKKGLVTRRQINRERGGYEFVYKAVPKSHIKRKMTAYFDSFKKLVKKEISGW